MTKVLQKIVRPTGDRKRKTPLPRKVKLIDNEKTCQVYEKGKASESLIYHLYSSQNVNRCPHGYIIEKSRIP